MFLLWSAMSKTSPPPTKKTLWAETEMAYTPRTDTHACRRGGGGRAISEGLTFGLSPLRFSCISCATVCSRRLFSSACCRRSFISSRVSSSGCKGGRDTQPQWNRDTPQGGGVGEEGERTHQDSRFRGISLAVALLISHAAMYHVITQVAITVSTLHFPSRGRETVLRCCFFNRI